VRHQNTLFHTLLRNVPWGIFDKLVKQHNADKHVRKLPTKTQLVALLYGQLSDAPSLRALVASFASHATRLYHLGVAAVARSSLSDANAQRPAAVFAGLFAHLAGRVQGQLPGIGECVLLIDSTTLTLSRQHADWARFSAGVCGAKVHVVYDPDGDCPIYAAVTPQRRNDITAAKAMPIERGATYVFDLGYYDYGWWAQLAAAGCRIVTRFKSNTPLRVETERHLPPGGPILADRTGYLPTRLAASRSNPMSGLVREVVVRLDTGKVLRILSNDLTASAQEIANLYKRRWAIELFFRWIKQTLRITRFMGANENAVRIQVAVALIAFLLLRLAQTRERIEKPALLFARLVRANIMHRKTIADLFAAPAQPPPDDIGQGVLRWA
jgi:transposase